MPSYSKVLVASPFARKSILSPVWSLRIVFVDPSNRVGTAGPPAMLKLTAEPKARTFCSGWYMLLSSVSEMALAVIWSLATTIHHLQAVVAVPASCTKPRLQRMPVIVAGNVVVNNVEESCVASSAAPATLISCLSIGRTADFETMTGVVRLRFREAMLVEKTSSVNVYCVSVGCAEGHF